MNMRWKARLLKHLANLWGPYLLSGIRVTNVTPDFRAIDVRMALRPWNRNYVGTHFGGSLFSMADPWFMVALIQRLGPDYVVWDKEAAARGRPLLSIAGSSAQAGRLLDVRHGAAADMARRGEPELR